MIAADVDFSAVLRGMDRMGARAKDLRKVWAEVKPDVRAEIKEHFADREGPSGSWASWAASTQQKFLAQQTPKGRYRNVTTRGQLKAAGARRLANILGRLRSAYRFAVTASELTARWIVSWANVQNTGGRVGRGAELPERKFAFAGPDIVARVKRAVILHVVRSF